ncbi:CRE-LIN-66 protein [Caenorhabditis remanei]|uniref:CRE-LIN-66 protein n=2 Tax=Caenorhabditis remanei TaxID=31234 RepID=E3NBN0_CAERE|nr:CRE-LIN-66 protein [Caenorhabditis remanei]
MAYDMNSLFSSNQPPLNGGGGGPGGPPQQQQGPQSLWSLQQFSQMGGPDNFHNAPFMPQLGMMNQYQNAPHLSMPPPQPLIPPSQLHQPMPDPQRADSIQGFGTLTWLSAKAGLITCKDKMVISFQLKDFCDQMLNDLTSVLRVGFTLSFHAALNETSEYTATIVNPIYGPDADVLFLNAAEVDLEAANPTPPNSKDAYSPALEQKAIPALLAIFQRHGLQQIQLSRSFSLHSQMSNCGDDELFRYVGTSSLKRRQFVERRTHLFRLQNDDSIILQYPAVYQAVYQLASFLLRHGGATSIQSLFDYYMSGDIPQEVRDHNGDGRQDFLNLLTAHNWVFALFPNRTYVSVRRNLPSYDYVGFIKQHFPELDSGRRQMGYGQPPRGIQRTMSAQMGGSFASGRGPQQSLLMQQHQHPMTPATNRPGSLWDSQSSLSQSGNSGDQWSPLFSPSTWSNTPSANPRLSSLGGIGSMNETLLSGVNYNALLAMPPSAKNERSIGVQADDLLDRMMVNPIGRSGCTCQCQCGRGGAAVIGTTRGSSSRASGGSATPPSVDGASQIDRLSPSNHAGSIGDRTLIAAPLGVDIVDPAQQAGGDGAAAQQRYYDPFGTADLLNGTRLNSLRIGN